MTFSVFEWLRLISYLIILVATGFLAHRYASRRNWPTTLLYVAIWLFCGWLAIDLTLVSIGLSSRDTRGWGSIFVVLLAASVVSLAIIEFQQMRYARQLHGEITEIAERIKEKEETRHALSA